MNASVNCHTKVDRLYGQVVARWFRPDLVPEEPPVSFDGPSQRIERGEWKGARLACGFAEETV